MSETTYKAEEAIVVQMVDDQRPPQVIDGARLVLSRRQAEKLHAALSRALGRDNSPG